MGKISILSLANIRKNKGQTVSLLVFVLIAAMLLNLGLLLIFDFGKYFDTRAEELNSAHFSLFEPEAMYDDEQLDYLRDYPGFIEAETEKSLGIIADISYNDGKMPSWLFFMSADHAGKMNGLDLAEGLRPATKDEVCLPYMFKVGGGYELGDAFDFTLGGHSYSYRVTGFTEEVMFGSINNQIYKLFLNEEGYKSLEAALPDNKSVLLNIRLEDQDESERLNMRFVKTFFFEKQAEGVSPDIIFNMDYVGAKLSRTMISSITSLIMIVFAGLIVLISLIVIRFRIRNSVDENMTNIGALKATGYTSGQIIASIVLQFCSVSAVAVLGGIAASYAALPAVSKILEAETAITWHQGFDAGLSLITCLSILLVVFAVSLIASGRIKRLHPLEALRGGLTTHSFKRNHFPLDRAKAPLSVLLALKTLMRSKSQAVMIFIIVTVVAFAATSGLSIYFNLGVDQDAFAGIIGGEVPDAAFTVRDSKDAPAVHDELKSRSDVRKSFYYQNFDVMIGEATVNNIAADDYAQFEGTMLYDGRYPKHDNEIVITSSVARDEGKGIGDEIEVMQGGRRAEYLITGLIQSVNGGGYMCGMTIEGTFRIQPDFQPREIYVYLENPAETAALIKEIERAFGPVFENVVNLEVLMEAQLSVFESIFGAVAAAIFIVTILIILLVLYLILNTVILRGRRELGIQKAIGFTTTALMRQIAISVMPAVIVGVAAGGIAGALGFNSIFVALVQSMGIMTASMPTPVGPTIIMCIGLVLIAYVISILITRRIRKINPYTLITE